MCCVMCDAAPQNSDGLTETPVCSADPPHGALSPHLRDGLLLCQSVIIIIRCNHFYCRMSNRKVWGIERSRHAAKDCGQEFKPGSLQ